uniref:Protein kinase domain-containing protein n=1 Tax=Meloidogyne enterolobii TaxID=390850 RepID=A0A6V7UPR0_MELEN|nr:unnamed protein product [Meloidogyne enterolobii]
MHQSFVYIDSSLLALALLLFSILLPAYSCIHCIKKKSTKKAKGSKSEDELVKSLVKKLDKAKKEMKAETPKKPTLEADGAAKVEKKPGGGKGDNSPKDDQLLLQAKGGDVKKAPPADKGKEEGKEVKASSRSDIISIPIGVSIGQYRVEEALGSGGCGVVYKVKTKSGEYHAMKLERTDQKRRDQLLPLEAHVLKQLQFTDYAAKFIEYGKCSSKDLSFHVLVMALLGKSISDLQDKRPKFKFTTGTVLRIGLQALRGIAFLHSIYYVHRDVKPSNFAIDRNNQKRVYLIDFGLSRSLRKRATKLLRKPRAGVPFRGTPGYCSLNAHKRVELGRHDDLWSLVYMMVDLNNGSLPWFGQENREHAAVLKEFLIESEYMHGCPLAFRSIMDYLRTLTYKQRPDYNGLESIFIQMLEARDISSNQPMDWEPLYIKRPEEVRKPSAAKTPKQPILSLIWRIKLRTPTLHNLDLDNLKSILKYI